MTPRTCHSCQSPIPQASKASLCAFCERRFPGVDIDRIHHLRGAVTPQPISTDAESVKRR